MFRGRTISYKVNGMKQFHLRQRELTRESGYESLSQMYRDKRTAHTVTGVNKHKWLRANDEKGISWL